MPIHRTINYLPGLFFIWFLLIIDFNSQAQSISDTIELKPVEIVSAADLISQSIVSSKTDTTLLRYLETKSLAQLLADASPVFIKTYGRGASASVSFRGTASSHTQVLWNGININSPMRGDVDFSNIPVYFIDDVSLLYGGSSLQQSSGAFGGSIQLKNIPNFSKTLEIKYIQEIESFNTFREFFLFGFGNTKFQSKTKLFHDQSENNFDYYNWANLPHETNTQSNANYSKYGFQQELYGQVKPDQLVSLKIQGLHSFRNLPQLMSYQGSERSELQEDDEFKAVGSWESVQNHSKWNILSSFQYHSLHYLRKSLEANFVNFNSTSHEYSSINQIGYNYQNYSSLFFSSAVNINGFWVTVYDEKLKSGYQKMRPELSWTGQLSYVWNEFFTTHIIARSEFYDNKWIPIIPALMIHYQFLRQKNMSLKANISRNYHKPGLNDLYWIPGGNPQLKPEDGYGSDLAVSWNGKSKDLTTGISLNIFSSWINNWIIWQPSASGAYYWEANNVKTVWARGFELLTSVYWQAGNHLNFKLIGNYSFTRTTNEHAVPSVDESRGKQLIYVPLHSANVSLASHYKNLDVYFASQIVGQRFTTSNNNYSDFEQKLNPYTLSQLDFGYSINMKKWYWRLGFKIENLFNQDYMTVLWRAMPSRYYNLSLQIKWNQ